MLNRPSSCEGCPLHPIATGFMAPALASNPYGVALVGEALGATEAEEGAPFRGAAGFKLTRLIEWAGLDRGRFDIWNTVWCQPPSNKLEGEAYEAGAINHCRGAHWGSLVQRARVLVPMGNVPLNALLGRKGITKLRGYVYNGPGGARLVPTVHPSFIQRGQSKYSAAFIHDLQKAVELATNGMVFDAADYVIDPLPLAAYNWARAYREALERDPFIKLAYDIETPGKDEDEEEVAGEEGDKTFHIFRIGFSYKGLSALTVPWDSAYIPAIRLLLESEGPKVVWNGGFDNPRIRAKGVAINGLIHDGMVAWHILHSDLPKGLGFVATFTCPWQHEWKSMSHSHPGLYNCIDADVEWRSMEWIETQLKAVGLWEVYQTDVLDLEPILLHMTREGMPVDAGKRTESAVALAAKQAVALEQLEALSPMESRKVEHVYVQAPKDTTGLLSRPGIRTIPHCSNCGAAKPRKDHFKHYVKKQNPCDGAVAIEREVEVDEFYRLAAFKPSREQLLRYQAALGRVIPTQWDKKLGKRKPSMNEKSIKQLIGKYPLDKLYPLVLEYRELDKLAGTYIGRPSDSESNS